MLAVCAVSYSSSCDPTGELTHHDGGQLQEGEAAVEVGVLVLDEADVGGRQGGEGRQRRQDGLHRRVRAQVPQDQSWVFDDEKINQHEFISYRACRSHDLTS